MVLSAESRSAAVSSMRKDPHSAAILTTGLTGMCNIHICHGFLNSHKKQQSATRLFATVARCGAADCQL
jgi:hypothetical protein